MFALLFANKKKKIKQALLQNAVIIDIRKPYDYDMGHFPGSQNIPYERIQHELARIKNIQRPIILTSNDKKTLQACINTLKHNQITQVINGGIWQNVYKIMEEL